MLRSKAVIFWCVVLFCMPGMSVFAKPETVDEATLLPIFADVLRKGGMGLVHTEAAAFIVDHGAGLAGCMEWPVSGLRQRQTYRGPVPFHAIAVVHSHPGAARLPSGQDILEARRSGMPFYVVTRDSIWRANPDGSTTRVLQRSRWWSEAAAAGSPCRKTASYVAASIRSGRPVRWQESWIGGE